MNVIFELLTRIRDRIEEEYAGAVGTKRFEKIRNEELARGQQFSDLAPASAPEQEVISP